MESFQPAFYVPDYMKSAGFEIVPVPVYYPDETEILGEKVYRSLTDIPGEIDLVNIFRRSTDVAKHTAEILAKKPKAVWMQSGIYNARSCRNTRQSRNQSRAESLPDGRASRSGKIKFSIV